MKDFLEERMQEIEEKQQRDAAEGKPVMKPLLRNLSVPEMAQGERRSEIGSLKSAG